MRILFPTLLIVFSFLAGILTKELLTPPCPETTSPHPALLSALEHCQESFQVCTGVAARYREAFEKMATLSAECMGQDM